MVAQLVANALALLLLAAPLVIDAQPSATIPRLGLLAATGNTGLWEPLRQGLRDLGYVEGKNIVLEYRRSEGRSERLSDLAAELVRLKVDIIVTEGTPATSAAKRATTTIPIVMAFTGDPLSSGLVSSLGRPGGNVTGLTDLGAGLATKRVALLNEAVPKLSRLAFLWNPANPAQISEFNEVQAGARSLSVTLQALEVRSDDELEPRLPRWCGSAPPRCSSQLTRSISVTSIGSSPLRRRAGCPRCTN